jgi:hypothetical protein
MLLLLYTIPDIKLSAIIRNYDNWQRGAERICTTKCGIKQATLICICQNSDL